MTTDVIDSTNVNSLQPLSLNFNAKHNGVQCIESLNPEDKGTERQFWFTRQMLREIFDVKSDNTITNHVETLVKRGVVDVVKNLTTSPTANSIGAIHDTTLYDRFQCTSIRLKQTKTVADTTHAFSIYRLEEKSEMAFTFFLTKRHIYAIMHLFER